ncbi:MAG TPA: hypothetical protein VN229_08350, partial [Terriglobales bacterium]|nr:hypothetical protein [Terriglobales bacterium]
MSDMDKSKPNPTQASTLRIAHWQGVYGSKAETQVSWFETSPMLSLELMAEAGFPVDIPVAADGPRTRDTAIIDIGGGASRMVDALLQRGYRSLSVLDISAAALAT